MTKFYVDAAGVYLGAFSGSEPPAGAIEVPTAPEDARQIWNGTAWSAVPIDVWLPVHLAGLIDAMQAEGILTAAKATSLRNRLTKAW